MTNSTRAALLGIVTLGVAAIVVHLFLPGGLPALLAKVLPSPSAPAVAPAAPAAPVAPPPVTTAAAGANDLRSAERAYDLGDFDHAIDFFVAARADADREYRDRAASGLQKAVLAWALTFNAPLPSPLPDDPDAEIARRHAAAEKDPNERAWYDLTLYVAAVAPGPKLRYLAQQALGAAMPGGPVETRLNEVLAVGGKRGYLLRDALQQQGLLAPRDPAADDGRPAPVRKPAKALSPPAGNFTEATKAKLAKGAEFEEKGTAEYDQTGPENPQRQAHRKAAYNFLKQARDIYEAAQEENPNSPDLDRHLHAVMEMLSPLRKEMGIGDH